MAPMVDEIALTGYRFPAFGGEVTAEASGSDARDVLRRAAELVHEVSNGLSRFDPASELSRINADPRETVEAGPVMIRFVEAAIEAVGRTEGLVDATLLSELEEAGYVRSMSVTDPAAAPVDPEADGVDVPRSDLGPNARWQTISIDRANGKITRRPGIRFDAGGIGKGLTADLVAELMEDADVEAWSIDCLGDVRIGGTAGETRPVAIGSPFPGQGPLETLRIGRSGIATSGITKRSWAKTDGTSAHHLIDPRTGRPAESDLIQVTALAPTAVEAEARAKAALLSGFAGAERWLTDGGLAVDRDGRLHRFGRIADSL